MLCVAQEIGNRIEESLERVKGIEPSISPACYANLGLIMEFCDCVQQSRRTAAKLWRSLLEWERVDEKLGNGEMVESQVRQVLNDILERVGEAPLPPRRSLQRTFTASSASL
jgi:hypothetical protein